MSTETAPKNMQPVTGGFRIRSIFYFAAALLLLLSIVSYTPFDNAILAGGVAAPYSNWIGASGALCSAFCFHLVGLATYVIPLLLLLRLARRLLPGAGRSRTFWSGSLLLVFGLILLLGLVPETFSSILKPLGLGRDEVPQLGLSGGTLGQILAAPQFPAGEIGEGALRELIGAVGTTIFGWALLTGGLLLLYIADWHEIVCGSVSSFMAERAAAAAAAPVPAATPAAAPAPADAAVPEQSGGSEVTPAKSDTAAEELDPRFDLPSARRRAAAMNTAPQLSVPVPPVSAEKEDTGDLPPFPMAETTPVSDPASAPAPAPAPAAVPPPRTPEVSTRESSSGAKIQASSAREYVLPPITMLAKGTDVVSEDVEAIARAKEALQRTLEAFQIPGQVTGHITGPRVTRFEITLEPGVNVKKVESIQDNIAMNLSATSVRILAPIPGRPVVGVEVSNSKPEAVFMRSVMESEAWQSGKAEIPIALGKDVSGKPVVLDLAKAPHLLVAGATGTGKSVCTNSLIVSLLFHFKPDELKLIMVDPKVVEFEDYRHLPHLLTPIINDSSKVPLALRWAVNEMEHRYRVLAKAGVKKLSEFNRRPVTDEELLDENGLVIPQRLPLLIVIIDELADLMMTEAKKDAETSITRIAQKGRAAGIHIVVATQRPSTNIITGVIKANLPTRLCFQVRSMVDSRVVLDTNGAEKLLGMGDMLCMSPSSMNIERVQGAWVKDDDIKAIVKFVSDQAPQSFNDNVLAEEVEAEETDNSAFDDDDDDFDRSDIPADLDPVIRKYTKAGDDNVIKQAIEVVLVDRKISTSYLQRRLKIGYNRAAEVIDTLEERGIVGPPSGSGNKREILIFDNLNINEGE